MVVGPPPPSTRKNGELASAMRLSPARPTNARGDSSNHGSPGVPSKSGSGIGVFANGSSTLFWHEASARVCSSVRRRALVEPREVGHRRAQLARRGRGAPARTRARAPGAMNGICASSVAAEERAPGRRVARERADLGQRRVERASAGRPTRSTSRSAGIAARRLSSWRAKPDIVSFRPVTRSASASSFARQRAEHLRLAVEHAGQVVRLAGRASASFTSEVVAHASSQCLIAWLKPRGAASRVARRVLLEQELQVLPRLRLERREHLAELHRHGGLVGRDRRAGAELRRVRAARVEVDEVVALEEQPRADLELGVPLDRQARSSISIVTRALPEPSSIASTFVTLPTSTPAIRTGELLSRLAESKTACSSYGLANGFCLVKPK